MKKLVFLFLFCTVLYKMSISQLQADNWIYSPIAGINFNGASNPTSFNLPVIPLYQQVFGAPVCYSDNQGSLLFYGAQGQLFDKNFQRFPSTDLYAGTALYNCFNIISIPSQTALAVPLYDDPSIFYYFHLKSSTNPGLPPFINTTTLHYTKINMHLRNGLGEVDPVVRNIPLLGGVGVQYKMTAALHCNKKDFWLIGHLLNSDQYFSILIKQDGAIMPPQYFAGSFISNSVFNGGAAYNNKNWGGCKVAASGTKFAAAFKEICKVELFDFNNVTGLGSNLKTIYPVEPADTTDNDTNGPIGLEFSPSGNVLYTNSFYANLNSLDGRFLHQFNTNLSTEVAIQASKYLINKSFEIEDCDLQIANNGKMYTINRLNLDEIANPENLGAACNYTPNIPNTTTSSYFGNITLPSFLTSYFKYPVIATGNCQFQNISFAIQNPIGVSSMVWDFGDPASGVNNTSTSNTPTHIFSTQGSYMVKAVLQNSNGCGADTIRKVVYAGQYKVFLGNDTTYCAGDSIYLKMNIPFGHNQWNNGSKDTILKITQPGTYWVTVRLGECTATDSIVVTQAALPQFTLGADTVICNNAMVTLAPNPTYNNSTYLWSNNAVTPTNTVSTAGLYWLRLTNNKGCVWRDSIQVSFKTLPNYTLGIDTSICQKDTITLNAIVPNVTSYTWSTGATTPTIKAFATNTYWCDVNKEGCVYRDSMNLLVKPLPIVNLGKDTTICEDKNYLLDAINIGATYYWQDATTNPMFTVTNAGTYTVKVTLNGCITKDTTVVQYQLKPKFTLGADKLICPGLTITLDPKLTTTGLQYNWQDGTTLTTYNATQQGLYYVDISNYCGDTRDSITITKGLCKVYVPTAFTPNGDMVNDVFKVGGGEAVTNFSLTIFNRWGTKVFTTKNISEGWNGTLQNKPQPTGAYIYQVEYKDATTNETFRMKGTVLLVR
jgi:gliding motility-associated-like protein